MELNLITVSFRATLAKRIEASFCNSVANVEAGIKCIDTIKASNAQLDEKQNRFFLSAALIGFVGYLESYLADTLRAILISFPGKLSKKEVSLDSIAENGTAIPLVTTLAERMVYDLTYSPFDEVIRAYRKHVGAPIPAEALVHHLMEIKSTRDVLAHGEEKANDSYLRKAGAAARARGGDILPLNQTYVIEASKKISELMLLIDKALNQKYSKYGRATALQEMWEATHLQSVMPFTDAWTVEPEFDMVRPTKQAKEWLWSGSEGHLYNFFRYIYGGRVDFDPGYIAERFGHRSVEAQILANYFLSPFHF